MDSSNQIATLTLNVDPHALRSIISSGKLLEFTNAVATQAAAQISAQLVQRVAEAALEPKGIEAGIAAQVSYINVIDDGEPGFGTRPPRPHWGVTQIENIQALAGLRQMATGAGQG